MKQKNPHVTSLHVTSRHVTSRHITSRHVTSRLVPPRHATSRHVTSRHVMSRPVTSRHNTSPHVTPRHVAHTDAHLRYFMFGLGMLYWDKIYYLYMHKWYARGCGRALQTCGMFECLNANVVLKQPNLEPPWPCHWWYSIHTLHHNTIDDEGQAQH